jgi:hypothetical protein
VFTYYKVISEIRYELGLLEESVHEISAKALFFNRFSLYPLVIVVCYLPVLCKRVYEISTDDSIYWLTIFSAVTTSIIGLLNAIVYGLTNNVKQAIVDSCCKKRRNSETSQFSVNETQDGFINVSS